MIPSYRERLRVEGAMLAGSGAVAAVLVLAGSEEAVRRPWSTVVQVAVVALLMATLGSRSVRRSLERAAPLDPAEPGTGEPTPLWQHPLIVAALAVGFGLTAGWDAALRVGGGCVVVGLAQAILFERMVRREEAARGVRFHRAAGSSLFTGTRLGTLP